MKIIHLPDPVLRKKAQPVKKITPKILTLIKEMVKTLKKQDNPPGVGLAAPQVGQSLQIFLIMPPSPVNRDSSPLLSGEGQGEVEIKKTIQPHIELFINPKILSMQGKYQEDDKKNPTLEGCLSLHGYYGSVTRANEITVEYETFPLSNLSDLSILKSAKTKKIFIGFPAVIVQHEFDHLKGKLFIDRILEQKQKLFKVGKDDTGKEVLEEVGI